MDAFASFFAFRTFSCFFFVFFDFCRSLHEAIRSTVVDRRFLVHRVVAVPRSAVIFFVAFRALFIDEKPFPSEKTVTNFFLSFSLFSLALAVLLVAIVAADVQKRPYVNDLIRKNLCYSGTTVPTMIPTISGKRIAKRSKEETMTFLTKIMVCASVRHQEHAERHERSQPGGVLQRAAAQHADVC